MRVKKEFGSAPGEEEAGRARQNVFFLCLVFFFFPFVRRFWGEGERAALLGRRGSLCVAASDAGRGWDLGLSKKPTAVVSAAG